MDELNELLGYSLEEIRADSNKRIRLFFLYKFVFGVKECVTCNDKLTKVYQELKNKGAIIMENKENRTFELKRDTDVVSVTLGSKPITNFNLTDELALEYLSKNKKRISNFGKHPDDWEAQVDAFEAPKPKRKRRKRSPIKTK